MDYAWQHGLTQSCFRPCTSEVNKWISPALQNVEPLKASDMVLENPRLRFAARYTSTVRHSTVSRKLFSPARTSSDSAFTLDDIASAVYTDSPDAVACRYSLEAAQPQYEPYADVNVMQTLEVETLICHSDGDMVMYAKKFPDSVSFVMPHYNESQLRQFEEDTCDQSESELWHRLRTGRVSGSTAHDVVTKMKKQKAGKDIQTHSLVSIILSKTVLDPNIPALKYGRELEAEAVQAYVNVQKSIHHQLQVDPCGLFIDSEVSCLCATPDRVVHCTCCGSGLLEVKCPLTSAGMDPKEAKLPYLSDTSGQLILKHSHKYFTQVQVQLGVTQRPWCDFFVYSRHGYFLERIAFDSNYWQYCKEMCTDFFTEYVLPNFVGSV